jgi:hypothetical protein
MRSSWALGHARRTCQRGGGERGCSCSGQGFRLSLPMGCVSGRASRSGMDRSSDPIDRFPLGRMLAEERAAIVSGRAPYELAEGMQRVLSDDAADNGSSGTRRPRLNRCWGRRRNSRPASTSTLSQKTTPIPPLLHALPGSPELVAGRTRLR